MADIVDTLLQQPKNKLVGGWVASLLLVAFLFYYFMIAGLMTGIEEAQADVAKLESTVLDLRAKLRKLNKLKKLMAVLEERIAQAELELPEKEEMPKLLSTLSGLARSSGLEIQLFRSEQEIFEEYYVKLPVSVKVRGGFHQVASFFDEVGRLDRIVNVTDIGMREPQVKSTKDVKVTTSCNVTTFRQLTEEEKEARKEQEKNQGRKRR